MHRFKQRYFFRLWTRDLCLLFALLCFSGCAEGLVLEPTPSFHENQIDVPKAEASATPEPSTPLEHLQYRAQQAGGYAQEHKGLVWPLFVVIGALWGLIQLLRWIYNLTTSSPSLM